MLPSILGINRILDHSSAAIKILLDFLHRSVSSCNKSHSLQACWYLPIWQLCLCLKLVLVSQPSGCFSSASWICHLRVLWVDTQVLLLSTATWASSCPTLIVTRVVSSEWKPLISKVPAAGKLPWFQLDKSIFISNSKRQQRHLKPQNDKVHKLNPNKAHPCSWALCLNSAVC